MDKAVFKSIKRMLKKYLPSKYREWFDSRMQHANDPSLNQRLKQLADQLGPVAEELVGDVTVWGRVVSKCRNDLTHLEGLRKQYDCGDLYWLAEGVFNVTRLCLLVHVGLHSELLPNLAKSWPIQGAQGRVRDAVERLEHRSSIPYRADCVVAGAARKVQGQPAQCQRPVLQQTQAQRLDVETSTRPRTRPETVGPDRGNARREEPNATNGPTQAEIA